MDKDRILEKINELENYLRELEEYLPEEEEEYLNSGLIKRACERAFQLAGENLLDICNLIISEKGFMTVLEFQNRLTCNHRHTENPANGGASPGSGVATPAP